MDNLPERNDDDNRMEAKNFLELGRDSGTARFECILPRATLMILCTLLGNGMIYKAVLLVASSSAI